MCARSRAALEPREDEAPGRDDQGSDPVLGVVVACLGAGRRAVAGEERRQRVLGLDEVDDRHDDHHDAEHDRRDHEFAQVHGARMLEHDQAHPGRRAPESPS